MSFDLTQLTAENTPNRWKVLAKYLNEDDPEQLAMLDPSYRALMETIYEEDFDSIFPPSISVSFNAGGSNLPEGLFAFNVTNESSEAIVTHYYGVAAKAYDGSAPDPVSASNEWDPSVDTIDVTSLSGFTAVDGMHYVFSFQAADDDGKSAIPRVYSHIYKPAQIAAVDIEVSGLDVVWPDQVGTTSYNLYYGADLTDLQDPSVTTIAHATSGEELILDPGAYEFMVEAVNAAGTTQSEIKTVTIS